MLICIKVSKNLFLWKWGVEQCCSVFGMPGATPVERLELVQGRSTHGVELQVHHTCIGCEHGNYIHEKDVWKWEHEDLNMQHERQRMLQEELCLYVVSWRVGTENCEVVMLYRVCRQQGWAPSYLSSFKPGRIRFSQTASARVITSNSRGRGWDFCLGCGAIVGWLGGVPFLGAMACWDAMDGFGAIGCHFWMPLLGAMVGLCWVPWWGPMRWTLVTFSTLVWIGPLNWLTTARYW